MSSTNDFIAKIAPYAVKDMIKTQILASLTIAQAALESGWGGSSLTRLSNNLFGIKGSYNGQSRSFPTKEFINGAWVTVDAPFRVYPSWSESIADHSALFHNGTHDRPDRYHNLIGERDYKTAARHVAEDGYATDPAYTTKLIDIIETYDLEQYDQITPAAPAAPTWKETIMQNGLKAGLTTQLHDPDEPAPKWFVIQTILNSMKEEK